MLRRLFTRSPSAQYRNVQQKSLRVPFQGTIQCPLSSQTFHSFQKPFQPYPITKKFFSSRQEQPTPKKLDSFDRTALIATGGLYAASLYLATDMYMDAPTPEFIEMLCNHSAPWMHPMYHAAVVLALSVLWFICFVFCISLLLLWSWGVACLISSC